MRRGARATAAALGVAVCGVAAACARAAAAPAPVAIRIPVGEARLDSDGDLEPKLGGAFPLGMRSGANNCYVEALASDDKQRGEITFVARPPRGEGKYLVELEKNGPIGDRLVDCVRRVFDGFYHYTDKEPFDKATGTLRFAPEWISAPAPPGVDAVRAFVEESYDRTKVVRIAKASLRAEMQDVAGSDAQVFHHYLFDVEVEFARDGYEVSCSHNGTYKLFGTRPYQSRGAGHVCRNVARKAGERVTDTATVSYSLKYYPEVETTWKLSSHESKSPADFDR
jgi:hypothetical protein